MKSKSSETSSQLNESEKSTLDLLKGYLQKGALSNLSGDRDWWHQTLLKVLGVKNLIYLHDEKTNGHPTLPFDLSIEDTRHLSHQVQDRQDPHWLETHPYIQGNFLVFPLSPAGSDGFLLIGNLLPDSVLLDARKSFLLELHELISFADIILSRSLKQTEPNQTEPDDVSSHQEHIKKTNEEKNQALRHLAGGLAHEFNNLVSIILGHIDFARSEDDPTLMQGALDLTEKTCARMHQIVDHLLTYSGKKMIRPQQTDLRELVESALNSLGEEFANRNISLKKELHSVPLTWVDQGGFSQVVHEILYNALQASQRNSSITLILKSSPSSIDFYVLDQGEGIESENIEKIFDPFYTTKGSYGGGSELGKGLGLSTAQATVHQHSGNFLAQSRPGHGSLFGFSLPIKDAFVEEDSLTYQDIRILIIDSSQRPTEVIDSLLMRKGFQTLRTSNSFEALNHVESWAPHLILITEDIQGMDSLEFIETVNFYSKNIPTILIADNMIPSLIRRGSQVGIQNFVDKAQLENNLIEEIDWILKEKRLIKGNNQATETVATKQLKTLIVDDEPNIGKLFKRTLEPQGHHVDVLTDPFSCPQQVENNHYDLLFIDMVMPGLTGIELIKKLRKLKFENPIALMSGFETDTTLSNDQLQELNIQKTLHKPFKLNEIKQIIADVSNNPFQPNEPPLENHSTDEKP